MNAEKHYRYIVVEDEKLICRNTIKKIDALNLPLTLIGSANNGDEAMSLILEHAPEIVITDIRMPGYDGLQLAHTLHDHHPQIKTIILSGYDDFGYAQSAIHYGVFDYLLKPVTQQTLAKTLHKTLCALDQENETLRPLSADKDNLDADALCSLMQNYLQANYNKEISLHDMADHLGFTQEYLGKLFKKKYGETPQKYLTNLRMTKAKHLLINEPHLEIQQVGKLVGYQDAYYFSRAFKRYTGIQASEYRMNH